jgi:hypothetical protein
MNDELLRILEQLNELQASILQVMSRHGQIPEEALPSEMEEPEQEVPAPDTRIAWSGGVPPTIQEEFEATYGFKYQCDVPGVAYRKDTWTREGAWKSAQRVWKYLRKQNRVPGVPYNCLRKRHTENWYVWVYDKDLLKNSKWLQQRIKDRRQE